ncbi:MAG: ATP-binding protein, partial [Oscillospiraceae bacterium]|nr:ATP-binding protein [Oscillospiraceae bacterium]
MGYDAKVFARARRIYEERKAAHEEETARKRERIYALLPQVSEIDRRLAETAMEAVGAAIGGAGDAQSTVEAIAERSLALQEERTKLLVAAGFAPDCTDDTPLCAECGDTGFVKGGMCPCLEEIYREEQKKELSALLKLGEETFDSFNLEYYSSERQPNARYSAREAMELVYETCLEYARKFGEGSGSLFFTGAPGLGKTFLSTCIAKVVSEKGYSVVYDTASDVFARFENEKFGRGGEDEEIVHSDINRYMTCDLLILDDLGTEMTTS